MTSNPVYSLENIGNKNAIQIAFEIGVCLDFKLTILYFVELIFELLSFLNAIYLIKILSKVGIIHLNLKINCCNMCVCIVFRAIFRFVFFRKFFNF